MSEWLMGGNVSLRSFSDTKMLFGSGLAAKKAKRVRNQSRCKRASYVPLSPLAIASASFHSPGVSFLWLSDSISPDGSKGLSQSEEAETKQEGNARRGQKRPPTMTTTQGPLFFSGEKRVAGDA